MTPKTSQLQREIKQTRPFRSPGQEATVGLLRTADLVRRRFTEVVAPYGITLPQYNVLRILRGAGADGLPTLEVGERLIEQSPGVTRMMDRLERHGWVRRERSADDRREVRCYLTRTGRSLANRLDGPMDRADVEATSGLSRAEQRTLIRLLDKVRQQHA